MRRSVIDIAAPAREFGPPSIPILKARQLRPRSERSSIWFAFAVFTGAIVALAFVRFLAR